MSTPDHSHSQSHICTLCHYVYEEAEGLPAENIAPGTAWANVPADWCCPECGASKDDFAPYHG